MRLLGIETSGRAGSVAVSQEGVLLGERDLSATGRRHARTLVPEISDLLTSLNLTPRDIDVVAVSIGPGSFTGLRVGVVCAKTFAYAVGCKLVAVDTFLAVAHAQAEADEVWVVDDPLRGDLFIGKYQKQSERWICIQPASLISLETWKRERSPNEKVTGPGLTTLGDELKDFQLGDASTRIPHARSIVSLGWKLAQSGNFSDPWSLAPFYMRRSAAEEKADEKAQQNPS